MDSLSSIYTEASRAFPKLSTEESLRAFFQASMEEERKLAEEGIEVSNEEFESLNRISELQQRIVL